MTTRCYRLRNHAPGRDQGLDQNQNPDHDHDHDQDPHPNQDRNLEREPEEKVAHSKSIVRQ